MNDDECRSVLDKAAEKYGKPCRLSLVMRDVRRPRPDGWLHVGNLEDTESRQAHQVYFHPVKQQGWLWALKMLPNGVTPRRFDPPEDVFRTGAKEGTLSRIDKRAAQRKS